MVACVSEENSPPSIRTHPLSETHTVEYQGSGDEESSLSEEERDDLSSLFDISSTTLSCESPFWRMLEALCLPLLILDTTSPEHFLLLVCLEQKAQTRE